ncbi:uncharacterized protein LOC131685391 [Topomyia yanbarensis]|uniref:uncharacterized protein LOC131685391 n=1 Tax=Topomyia yanbarensis TaxID=2498891 RepID=UPI00273ADBDA|nr:uncharacterized protein LOC131685391 [Topomyia yanbarensis]
MSEPDFSNPTLMDDLKQEYEDSFDNDGQPIQDYCDDGVEQEDDNQAGSSFNDSTALASTSTEYQMQRKYTLQDLHPTLKDPRCDPNWPLANLWPVFVSNFRCADVTKLDFSLRRFFASKGLFVRWWFQQTDDYYREFQTRAGLYDMLVYFVSEKDAQLAIERCNRTIFEAYTLNVLDGREPVYFPADRTIYFKNMKSGFVFSQQFFEKHMARYGHVVCAVKYDIKTGAVEYRGTQGKHKARNAQRLWNAVPVPNDLKKQRYLEDDLRHNIQQCLQNYPDVLKVNENDAVTRWALGDPNESLLLQSHNTGRQYVAKPLRRGPTKSQTIKIQSRNDKKAQRRIYEDLRAGVQPRCYQKAKTAKKRFRKMLEAAKQEMGMNTGSPTGPYEFCL